MTVDILLINSLCSGLLKCVILFCPHHSDFFVCVLCCVFFIDFVSGLFYCDHSV